MMISHFFKEIKCLSHLNNLSAEGRATPRPALHSETPKRKESKPLKVWKGCKSSLKAPHRPGEGLSHRRVSHSPLYPAAPHYVGMRQMGSPPHSPCPQPEGVPREGCEGPFPQVSLRAIITLPTCLQCSLRDAGPTSGSHQREREKVRGPNEQSPQWHHN